MTHPTPSRRAQAAAAVHRPQQPHRDHEQQRRETERRMRRVAAWLRTFRSR